MNIGSWRRWVYLMGITCMVFILADSCKKEDDFPKAVTDIDGNVYHTVKIGDQVWMVENLKTTRYRNGDPIENIMDPAVWKTTTEGGYCNYINNEEFGNKFGRLYNWNAMYDSRQIAPKGWHVPNDEEWATLVKVLNYKVGTTEAQLLAANTDWKNTTVGGAAGFDLQANNATGFTALPGGMRDSFGTFGYVGSTGGWWSSSYNSNNPTASCRELDWDRLTLNYVITHSRNGLSIRCIKD